MFRLARCFRWRIVTLSVLHAQELDPRAYVITPVHSNAIKVNFPGGFLHDFGNVELQDAFFARADSQEFQLIGQIDVFATRETSRAIEAI